MIGIDEIKRGLTTKKSLIVQADKNSYAWRHQNDKPEKSIEVLKEGVSVAPNVWLLWQLLGNYQSDFESFD